MRNVICVMRIARFHVCMNINVRVAAVFFFFLPPNHSLLMPICFSKTQKQEDENESIAFVMYHYLRLRETQHRWLVHKIIIASKENVWCVPSSCERIRTAPRTIPSALSVDQRTTAASSVEFGERCDENKTGTHM